MRLLLLKAGLALFAILVGLLVVVTHGDQEVLIESHESRTTANGPVFNRIKWIPLPGRDVWMMNQSHHGLDAPAGSWDRLAIVVDKTRSPKTARYYQLPPGTLEWRENLPETSFRVSCFMCHNNGPRIIRPSRVSQAAFLGLGDRLKMSYWNLRIKLYGRVIPHEIHDERDPSLHPPFRLRSSYENEPLKVAACTKCHKEEGWFARGSLRRQQLTTIRFMVNNGYMPPLGFGLSAKERQELQFFLKGF
ncbi:MAG: cytochrome c [Bdellovibrionales bacterium]